MNYLQSVNAKQFYSFLLLKKQNLRNSVRAKPEILEEYFSIFIFLYLEEAVVNEFDEGRKIV